MDDSRDRIVRKGDYVYGSFVKPEVVDGYINGVNPGDRGDVLGRFSFSQAHVSEAVEFAEVGARAWRRFSLADRAAAVRRFRDQVARGQERLARMVSRETGKPLWESRQEVLASVRALDLLLDQGVQMLSPTLIEEIGARSDRVPRGVVGLLCPSNFPLLIPAMQGASAVLAGNAVVAKPSKFTPGVGQLIAELWDRCRLPRGVYNMVQGPGTVVGQRLVLHPQVSVLSVAGSYATAATIQRMTAERSELPVVVQSGGKGTAIVLDDAELDRAVEDEGTATVAPAHARGGGGASHARTKAAASPLARGGGREVVPPPPTSGRGRTTRVEIGELHAGTSYVIVVRARTRKYHERRRGRQRQYGSTGRAPERPVGRGHRRGALW